MGSGIGGEGTDELPCTALIARFLNKFPLCCLQRFFVRVHCSCRDLPENTVEPWPVLSDQHYASLIGNRKNVDPVGILEEIKIRLLSSPGNSIAPLQDFQPAVAEKILLSKEVPRFHGHGSSLRGAGTRAWTVPYWSLSMNL